MLQLVTLRDQRVNSFFFPQKKKKKKKKKKKLQKKKKKIYLIIKKKKKKKKLLSERSGELDILLANLNLSFSLIFGYQTFIYSLKAGSHMAL